MKKFLSMALAVVMTLSLFTFAGSVSAGAADYTDADQIQYKEAVDVISALNIMGGYSNGTFGPTGGLTRGAAAKIICNMFIGPDAANRLPANATTFSDVPSTNTFAAVIAYCYEQGFISGYSDSTFRPADPLSGYAFMKMLLCALGYDQSIENFVGANWRINVATKAMDVDIVRNLDENYNPVDAINREQATLLAFNTLQADMVEYDNKSTPVETGANGSIIINTGSNVARIRTWASNTSSNASNISNAVGGEYGRNIMQFAELKFSRLRKQDTRDDFDRPSVQWFLGGSEIGEYINTNDYVIKTYRSSKNLKDIYSDLNMTQDDTEARIYLNGNSVDASKTAGASKGNSSKGDYYVTVGKNTDFKLEDLVKNDSDLYPTNNPDARKSKVGDGCLVEVFYEDDKTTNGREDYDGRVTICITTYYPGEVTRVTAAKGSDPRTITISSPDYAPEDNFTKDDNNKFETTQFADDDIVLFTYAGNEIKDVVRTNSVEGSVSRYSLGNYVYVNGTRYNYAGLVHYEDSAVPDDGYNTSGDEYIVYLNSDNQIVWVDSAEFHENASGTSGYAFVRWITSDNESNGKDDNEARLLFTNATQRRVDLYKDYYKDWRTDGSIDANYRNIDGQYLVSYSQASDGTYRLNALDDYKWGMVTGGGFSISNRTMYGMTTRNGKPMQADATTVFVVENTNGTFRNYTGVRNVPNVSGNNITAAAYTTAGKDATNPTARYVFILNSDSVTTTSKDVTFIAAASAGDIESDDGDTYRTYNAVVAGNITQLRLDAAGEGLTIYSSNVPYTSGGAAQRSDFVSKLTVRGSTNNSDNNKGLNNGNDKAWNSVIVNNTESDDNLITDAYYDSSSVSVNREQGLKSPRNGQIEIATHGDDSYKVDLSSSVRAYYIDDDGNISAVNVNNLSSDDDAWVFYTMDDDSFVTNLFVCEDNA